MSIALLELVPFRSHFRPQKKADIRAYGTGEGDCEFFLKDRGAAYLLFVCFVSLLVLISSLITVTGVLSFSGDLLSSRTIVTVPSKKA